MKSRYKFRVLLFPLMAVLTACGGGGGSSFGGSSSSSSSSSSSGGSGTWTSGVYLPSSNFDAMCVAPRAGTSDRSGTATDQNNWLRSWTNELYLWYGEVTDRDPSLYATVDYFPLLKTNATTTSGQPKDKFHFIYDTAVWDALSQGGVEAGYGAEFAIFRLSATANVPRRIVVAFTETGTPAVNQLARGDEILQVDGVDAVNGGTQSDVNTLNAGLFPSAVGQTHSFLVRGTNGLNRTVTLTSTTITHVPVPITTTFSTASGSVGYIQFNDHIATAETPLMNAIIAARQCQRHRPHSRPALQRRRLPGSRQRALVHDRQHHTDGRPNVREDRLQRQESEPQSGHRANADADAVSLEDARGSRAPALRTWLCLP